MDTERPANVIILWGQKVHYGAVSVIGKEISNK